MTNINEKKLIFIYNADSDVINLVKDFWKKILRPSSYECNLCTQTYGFFNVKKDWKQFISNLDIETIFLHRDEFKKQYGLMDANFPSAYIYENRNLRLLISDDEMNAVKSIDELKELVNQKIEKFGL